MAWGSGEGLTAAVEGDIDEAVLLRLATSVELVIGAVHGRQGKPALLNSLPGYNNAARFTPWIVLVDLDRDCDCAPTCVRHWLPKPAPQMFLRVAVRAVEAWLLADGEGLSRWMSIAAARVPREPDLLPDPKRTLVDLARHSRRREIREGLVPREGSGRQVGALYASAIRQFVLDTEHGWRPERALEASPSLARCLRSLRRVSGQNDL